jgi:trigger factor
LKFEVHNLENQKAQIDVVVSAEKVEQSLDCAYRNLVKKVNLPGFRKGKVPRKIMEARFGIEAFYEDAIDILLPEAYSEALKESNLEPIDRPEVDVLEFSQGQEAKFRFVVQLPPVVRLGDYKGLEIEAEAVSVTDDEVEQELGKLRERHVRLVNSELDEVVNGDTVNIDYAGSVDGILFAGGSAQGHNLEIGSGSFIPGFEEQLIGMKRGEERDITVTFPTEYRNEELAGKEAVFHITLNEIKRKLLPELDDEFAKEVSEHETMDQLRAEHRERLIAAREKARKTRIENEVVQKVVDAASVEIPNVLTEREIDSMIEDLKFNLSRSGLKFEQYLGYMGKTEDNMREEFTTGAQNRVKTRLVLEAITKTEGITVDDGELEAHLTEMANAYGQTIEQIRTVLEQRGQLEAVRNSLVSGRTIDFLVEQSTINSK